MKKTYMTPKMECFVMNDIQPICTSGVGGSGISDAPGFGGIDLGGVGGKDPAAKEIAEFEEVLDGLLW